VSAARKLPVPRDQFDAIFDNKQRAVINPPDTLRANDLVEFHEGARRCLRLVTHVADTFASVRPLTQAEKGAL
jgi:hypothetical protein